MTSRFCFYLIASTLFSTSCGESGGGGTAVMQQPPPGTATTAIYDVQGSGNSSLLIGSQITVRGIVTGDFQAGDANPRLNLGGFFIQEEVPDAVADTSDGLFVFDGSAPATDVQVGDIAVVEGEILEYFGETQIRADSVSVLGRGTIQPLDLVFPLNVTTNSEGAEIADLERYEGMLVRVPQIMTVVSLFNLERFGEVQLATDGRRIQYTNQLAPDVTGYAAHQRQFASTVIVLDDGQSVQNANPVRFLFPNPTQLPDYSIRLGDTVKGLTGNIRYSRGSGSSGDEMFRLVPPTEPIFSNDNPREPAPPVIGGELKVASFNALNFFTSIDSGQVTCGPYGSSNCRGANSSEEFDRQRDKLVTALTILDADIVGLIEMENNASESVQSLVDGLNSVAGNAVWSFIDSDVIADSAIRVALVYKTTTVSPVGNFAILDSEVDARFLDSLNRPVLLQTFEQNSDNGRFSVAVSHLKSKGSPCDDIGDPDLADGQANCNLTRTAAVQALADWLTIDPTASGDTDFLIIGDLNAYLIEDPLTELKAAGFLNLFDSQGGLDAHTYQFQGRSGALDHALVSTSLATQVSGAVEWHINADEPPILDYNLEFGRDASLFDPTTPFRASDHDPLIIGLSLGPD